MILVLLWLRAFGCTVPVTFQTDWGQEFGGDNPDQVLRLSRQFLQPLDGHLARFPKGRKGYNGRVERSHRTDDEEFYRPYLLHLGDVSEFLGCAQRWTYFYNVLRPHFGDRMDRGSPRAALQDLSYTGHQAIAAFPPVLLHDTSTDLLMACHPEDGNDLLTHYMLPLLAFPSPPSIMALMAVLRVLNVSRLAAELDGPFSMTNVTHVSDIVVSLYICQGTLSWHKHLHNDELFWAYEGSILLESEWGDVRLDPGHLAVVPKGIAHRSSSGARATVLLLRCGIGAGRSNGRRRVYGLEGESRLIRVGLHDAVESLTSSLDFRTVVDIEDSVIQVGRGEGTWSVSVPAAHSLMVFVLGGTAAVHTSDSVVRLNPGDLTVVPQEAVYGLSTTSETALVRLIREDPLPKT